MAQQKTYQQLREELDQAMATLHSDSSDVDVAITEYEKATKIIIELEKYLDSAENKVKKIQKDFSA
jgi:exodeoxyribonuclease VII small subunit